MRLRVLGSSGSEFPGYSLPAFLIGDSTLLDAGTVASALAEREQFKLKFIFVTHAHLDHTGGIPFLADNLIARSKNRSVTVVGIPRVLDAIKKNLINNTLWPDFTAIPNKENGVLKLQSIRPGRAYEINGFRVTAHSVDHPVPATGFVFKDKKGTRLLYTGDTGPTEAIWRVAEEPLDCALIEVSFPNSMKELAVQTGHLTPELLGAEIKKMKRLPRLIFATHLKPQFRGRIMSEVKRLGFRNLKVIGDGEEYII